MDAYCGMLVLFIRRFLANMVHSSTSSCGVVHYGAYLTAKAFTKRR